MKTILVIEDSEEMQRLIHKILSSDYNLVRAVDGKDADRELGILRPDLIILDLSLPDIDGYELCDKYKSDSETKQIPIVILSATQGAGAHTVAYKLGADNYLEKPFSHKELKAIVDSKIKRSDKAERVVFENLKLDINAMRVTVDGNPLELAPKEFLVLKFLLTKYEEVVKRSTILELIWGSDSSVADRVVDNHINSLRRKLRSTNIQIKAIYGKGYIVSPLGGKK